jgi:hypothetical protein
MKIPITIITLIALSSCFTSGAQLAGPAKQDSATCRAAGVTYESSRVAPCF